MTTNKIPAFGVGSAEVKQLFSRVLPLKIASHAEQFFHRSFENQGFTDSVYKPWKPTKKGKTRFSKKAHILEQTLHLKMSVRTVRNSDGVIHIQGGNQHVPYARIHNEGGRISGSVTVRPFTRKQKSKTVTVREHKRNMNTNMPQRQFMGDSHVLNEEIDKIIMNRIGALEHKLFNV